MTEVSKNALLGDWVSIAPEVRPSKNPDGTLKSLFLTRDFKYADGDRFELIIVTLADPSGHTPLAKLALRGHMFWRGEHPIAPGAQKRIRASRSVVRRPLQTLPYADARP